MCCGFVLWTEMLPQGLKSLVGANKTKRKRIETSSEFIVALFISNDPSKLWYMRQQHPATSSIQMQKSFFQKLTELQLTWSGHPSPCWPQSWADPWRHQHR
mmetsp:Transcript_15273/g.23179  ORF Transcript_15273/g.23179 Transcript_15273/m.23179 type:complete len:101 (-) Transcript_15273:152-454(-)